MKKKYFYFIILGYLFFLLTIPLLYFIFYGSPKEYRVSLAYNTSENKFFIIGDPFVLNKVVLDDKNVSWQRQDNVHRSVNMDFKKNKNYRLFITDKHDNESYFRFRFPVSVSLEKQFLDFSLNTKTESPALEINKEKISLYEGEINTEYLFSQKKGNKVVLQNIIIDLTYQSSSAKIIYEKFFAENFTRVVKYSNVTAHFFIESTKFVFRVIVKFFKTIFNNLKAIASFIKNNISLPTAFFSKTSKISNNIYDFTKNRVNNLTDNFLAIFKRNYLYSFVTDIEGSTDTFMGTVNNTYKNFFKSVSNFLNNKFLLERQERKKQNKVVVIDNITKKIFTAGDDLVLDFKFFNGLGEPLINERVDVSFRSKQRNNQKLLSPATEYTDENAKITIKATFGHNVSDHNLIIRINKKSFNYSFQTEPSKPFRIHNIAKQNMLFEKAGKLIKNAFVLQVLDKYDNHIPDIKVELLEQDVNAETEPFLFAETISDKKGKVFFNYRMSDVSGRKLIIAKIAQKNIQFVYTVQSESTQPVAIEIVDEEEVEAIIGIPMNNSFKVKVLDDRGNLCPHIPVDFSFQTSMFEEIDYKRVRTDVNGIAEVEFRTPEVVGYFQIIASSPKVSEYEVAFVVLVMPGDAAKVNIITGNNQNVEWNKTSEPLVVLVKDDRGNPIPNTEIKWNTPKQIQLMDYDDITDLDGYARAVVRVGEIENKELNIYAQVGKVRETFKVFPREPSFYQLDLISDEVVNVFTNQMLPEPIEFILRDQYGNILPNEKVFMEYIVYRRGVQYLQNYGVFTNEEGRLTFNFLVSDQNDAINLKGKYYVDGRPRITWVKINVIPEEISNIIVPENIQGLVSRKLSSPIEIFIADNNSLPVSDIALSIFLKSMPDSATIEEEQPQYQLKTDKQGMVEFSPLLGDKVGKYVYTVKINDLQKDITINAIPEKPAKIKLEGADNPKLPVFKDVKILNALLYDEFNNLITNGKIVYNINNKKKVLKHDFNFVVDIDNSGITPLPFKVPEKKGNYFLYATDETYSIDAFYQFNAIEAELDSIVLLNDSSADRNFVVQKQYRNLFSTKVIDRFGNPIENAKLSIDFYKEGSNVSVIGTDAFSDASGIVVFNLLMPEKTGIYNVIIYSEDYPVINQNFSVYLHPESAYVMKILSGNNNVVKANSYLFEDLSVLILDRFDNPVPEEQIRWTYSLDFRGENRQIVNTVLTNKEGIATFNFETDSVAGVKEIKASYRKNRTWQDVFFYIKVAGFQISSIDKIVGDNQIAILGKEIKDNYSVKLIEINDLPAVDIPVIFEVISSEENILSQVTVKTNKDGLATYKFFAPLSTGQFTIKAYPQIQPNLIAEFSLQVISEVLKSDELKEEAKNTTPYRLVPLQDERLLVEINDDNKLCEVVVLDRLSNPVKDNIVEWEIYDVVKDKTYSRKTKTNSEGKAWLPNINRSYERKLVIKVTESLFRTAVIFNVDIAKNIENRMRLFE
jgi:uncharacterized GH25 family protein